MKLEHIFVSKDKYGGIRVLFRKKYFYDVDRFYYVYIDINTKESFSSVDLRGKLIPFTNVYNEKTNLGKRRILKIYNENINKFN